MQLTVSTVVFRILMFLLLGQASVAFAQENPLTSQNKFLNGGLRMILLRSAEVMPEEHYGFKPVDEVRTFGQLVGHVADAQYLFCAPVLGEKNPMLRIEKTRTTKAELIASLKEAFAYCDKAYASVTDANATEPVKIMTNDMPKLSALTVSQMHSSLHYGNMIVYLRLKGIVPPSSDMELMRQLRKQ